MVSEVPGLGRKFIGVKSGGSLEIHGTERVSWSLLTRSIPATGLATGGHAFERNFSRGINLRVVDQDTAAVLLEERYDTHESSNDSQRLTQLLLSLPPGRIVALAVGDSAIKNFMKETKNAIKETLGSSYVWDLKYRYITPFRATVQPTHLDANKIFILTMHIDTCVDVPVFKLGDNRDWGHGSAVLQRVPALGVCLGSLRYVSCASLYW